MGKILMAATLAVILLVGALAVTGLVKLSPAEAAPSSNPAKAPWCVIQVSCLREIMGLLWEQNLRQQADFCEDANSRNGPNKWSIRWRVYDCDNFLAEWGG